VNFGEHFSEDEAWAQVMMEFKIKLAGYVKSKGIEGEQRVVTA
jgi:hypothetical protein